MDKNDSQRLIRRLEDIEKTLKSMNENHLQIGRLFKQWLDTETPEPTKDRERFVSGMRVTVTDPDHGLYKYTGIITGVTVYGALVEFDESVIGRRASFTPNQIKVATHWQVGMAAELVSPYTIYNVGEIGEVTLVDGDMIEVKFPSGSGGRFYRSSFKPALKLPESGPVVHANPFAKYTPDDQGRMYPYQWRHNLELETWFSATEDEHPHESEMMTEEAFRIYNAGL